MIINEAILENYRNLYFKMLPSTCTILHVDTIEDVIGGSSEVETRTEDVPCLVGIVTQGVELEIASRLGVVTPYGVTMPYGTSIQSDDKILYKDIVLEVRSILTNYDNEIAVFVICSKGE